MVAHMSENLVDDPEQRNDRIHAILREGVTPENRTELAVLIQKNGEEHIRRVEANARANMQNIFADIAS